MYTGCWCASVTKAVVSMRSISGRCSWKEVLQLHPSSRRIIEGAEAQPLEFMTSAGAPHCGTTVQNQDGKWDCMHSRSSERHRLLGDRFPHASVQKSKTLFGQALAPDRRQAFVGFVGS